MSVSAIRLAGALLGVGLLAACADSGAAEVLTLAETKSPVQLLRNEAASRVPEELLSGVLNEQDESTRCRTPETDPDGLLRSWRSVIRFELLPDTSDPQAVLDDLAGSFVDDGWDQGTYGVASIIELTRGGSETQIHLSVSRGDADAGTGPELQLAVSGPCVMTAGATSDEVVGLGDVGD